LARRDYLAVLVIGFFGVSAAVGWAHDSDEVTVTVRRTEAAENDKVSVEFTPVAKLTCSNPGSVKMSINGKVTKAVISGKKVVWKQRIPKASATVAVCQKSPGLCVSSVPLCSTGYKLDTSISCGQVRSLQCCMPDCNRLKSASDSK
jgi:hypothetical protein